MSYHVFGTCTVYMNDSAKLILYAAAKLILYAAAAAVHDLESLLTNAQCR